MDLFEQHIGDAHQPLAYRMRPRSLDEYIGQEHIVGHGRLLRRAIQADQLASIILYGPPGTGKTTLARVIANTTRSHFSTLNAVLSGVKELRYEIEEARNRLTHFGKRTILFVDEVHRWNKSQQDALLPWVENGTCILIGATTENPYFEVNSALVSRSRIFQLVPLQAKELLAIAQMALHDRERGYGNYHVQFEPGALEHVVDIANGDARSLLNALELAVETSGDQFPPPEGQTIIISREAAEESIQRKVVLYDKEGDYHFDIISAFIKSVRGSDPDATLYWMARMISAGEDPKFIFRRMLISATEDVGMADPYAIMVVEADAAAFERIGLPEGRFHLTHAALYLATAPKSNTTMAFFDALKSIEEERDAEVPNHLKDGNRDRKGFGHGEGYLYPHAYHNHWVPQQYLPSSLQGKVFYHPSQVGYEQKIREEVLRRRESQLEAVVVEDQGGNLTFSPQDSQRERWVQRTMSERGLFLERIRDTVFNQLTMHRHNRVLVLNAGGGLFVWEAFRRVPEGLVVAQATHKDHYNHLQHYAQTLDTLERPQLYQGTVDTVLKSLPKELSFEHIIGRNLVNRLHETDEILSAILSCLTPSGIFSLAQIIPSLSSRLSHFISDREIQQLLEEAEDQLYCQGGNAATNWRYEQLLQSLNQRGTVISEQQITGDEHRMITPEYVQRWLTQSYAPLWEAIGKSVDIDHVQNRIIHELENRQLPWQQTVAIIQCKQSS
jgi:putative ATPase